MPRLGPSETGGKRHRPRRLSRAHHHASSGVDASSKSGKAVSSTPRLKSTGGTSKRDPTVKATPRARPRVVSKEGQMEPTMEVKEAPSGSANPVSALQPEPKQEAKEVEELRQLFQTSAGLHAMTPRAHATALAEVS